MLVNGAPDISGLINYFEVLLVFYLFKCKGVLKCPIIIKILTTELIYVYLGQS